MNTWMTGKNSRKHHYQRKNIFAINETWKTLPMENICTKRVCKDFEIKILGEYYDFYVQSDTILLAYVFNCFFA